jgi:hypothetical protein
MSDDRWLTDDDEPYQPGPEAARVLDGRRAPEVPRPRYGRTELPDRTPVKPEEIDAFLTQYCEQMGIDRNKGRRKPGTR